MKKAFCLFFTSILFFTVASSIKAASASLYLSPSSGSFLIGSTFTVSLFLNTEGNEINAVWAELKFPPEILQVTSPTAGSSFVAEWITPPNYSNERGIISFRGGIPGGISTSAGLVSSITFRAKASGVAKVKFKEDSKVLLNDGKGTDILTTTIDGEYHILVPAAEGPEVFSPTHPNPNLWYSDSSPAFSWEKKKGAIDFSWSFDQNSTRRPDGVSEGAQDQVSFSDVSDGIWYFHLRQRKDGVWGKTSHVQVRIDAIPPREFTPRVETYSRLIGYQTMVYFETSDDFSGIDHYEVSIIDLNTKESSRSFFTEQISPYKVPFKKAGKYNVIIRAVDKAGNIREGEARFRLMTPLITHIEGGGLEIRGVLLPWWLILLLIVVIGGGMGVGIWLIIRSRISRITSRGTQKTSRSRKIFFFCVILLAICASLLLTKPVRAAGASLYLSPKSGTFYVGSTFDISIFVNTEGNSINAVQADLKFPPELLQVTSPTAGSSFISIWADQPFYSNKEGIISFKGGVPSPGINTSAGLVSTVTFRAKAPGTALISFLESSKVLLADGKGTNILKTTMVGEYKLIIPPPEGPKLFSSTHPSLTSWYKNNNPSFYWEKESGVADFSYSLDQDPQGIPDNIVEGSQNSVTLNDIGDGIWYFHVKAKKDNVWGGVSHYPVQIDTTPPKKFSIDIERIGRITGLRFFTYFSTNDLLSGIDYYEISTIDLSDPQAIANPFFMEAVSPHQIPYKSAGKYAILIKAYDKAGNFTESKVTLTVVSPFISYTEKGIRIGILFLPWWLIYIFAGALLVSLIFGVNYILKRKNLAIRLRKEVAEAEKEIEDVEKLEEKIRKTRTLEKETRKESERLAERLRGGEQKTDKKNE